MTKQEARGLWITGFPSEEMEQDIEAWQRAEKILDGLSDAFISVRGDDVAFVVLIDAKVRIKKR